MMRRRDGEHIEWLTFTPQHRSMPIDHAEIKEPIDVDGC
jgi:hypothetical protein